MIYDEDDTCGCCGLSCGLSDADSDLYHDDFGELCPECFDACRATDVADILSDGRTDDARDLLMSIAPASVDVCAALIREAQDSARRGDWDEAAHRLRLLTDPKWESEAECRSAYDAAMAEKVPA